MPDSLQTALTAIQRVSTQTGLSVVAKILDQVYDIGRTCSDTYRKIKDQFIRHDAVLGEWNYLVDGRGLNA
ncbi:ISAzo13-like element transposase-related protein [Thiohalocapsa marina]|uniref:ISAzo13-like element transposase-related protein n=1 Tax=Thiohalocapsa marina TaxID=424902 RepID=UPI0036D76E4A